MNGKETTGTAKFDTVSNFMKSKSGTDSQTAEWVNLCHKKIESDAQQLIESATAIGEVLFIVQEKSEHGDFVKWLTDSVCFTSRSAYRYIALFRHKEKVSGAKNLTDAYKKIEASMTVKKEKEKVKAEKRAEEYNKTGKKPEGWRDHTDHKLAKQLKKQEKAEEETDEEPDTSAPIPEKEAEQETNGKRPPLLRRDGNEKKPKSADELFLDSIRDYIDDLSTREQKIAMCRTVMQLCREIIVDFS